MPKQRLESDLEHDVMRQQSDAAYMAKLAQQRHAIMESHVWDEDFYEETGVWRLKTVLDGSVHEQAAA